MKALLLLLAVLAAAAEVRAEHYQLQPQAEVDGSGVFLDDLVTSSNAVLGRIRLSPAPKVGQPLTLSRAQIDAALLKQQQPPLTNWSGAPMVRISRRTRVLDEELLKPLLTSHLQQEYVKERGELELRLTRPWTPVNIPDEPVSLRLIEIPGSGISPLFLCRVEISTTNETVGSWQVAVGAKVWREVWVSRNALRRGAQLAEADLVRERRDVLTIREALAEGVSFDSTLETAEHIPANSPVYARSIKARPVVRRGQSAEALVLDGALAVSMKVEVLEDGTPGQVIRIRNPQSKRELRGKVQNEQTILVSL